MTLKPRWVRRDEQKRPLDTHGWPASTRKRETWTSYRRARDSEVGVGLGFVLGDGIGCIDLDHCTNPDGTLQHWAAMYVERFRPSALLIERSCSGEGVHIFLPMAEARGRRIREGGRSIEVYSWGRYIAVTGDRI